MSDSHLSGGRRRVTCQIELEIVGSAGEYLRFTFHVEQRKLLLAIYYYIQIQSLPN